MLRSNRLLQRITLFCALVLVIVIVWGSLTPEIASSQQLDSRLSNLEVDINALESRLSRIESQLDQLRGIRTPRPTNPAPGNRTNQTQLGREQMFDRLATLVIELKQQVNKLEARVSKLEPQGKPRKSS